jgi:hypothetical protein
MSDLSKRMRSLRESARLRPVRISSAYDGGMTVAIMRGKIEEPASNIEFDCGHEEAHKGPMSWEFSQERAEFFAAAANETLALCDEVERLEAENAALRAEVERFRP